MADALRTALVKRLQATDGCPACGAFKSSFEKFGDGVFSFVAEAVFGCGARVQVSAYNTLDVSDACPEALRSALDSIEQDVGDAVEDAADAEAAQP